MTGLFLLVVAGICIWAITEHERVKDLQRKNDEHLQRFETINRMADEGLQRTESSIDHQRMLETLIAISRDTRYIR